jgi:heptosyltransferase-1
MQKTAPRIALVRLSALGDIVNSAIVLQFIKKSYPHAQIEWFCEEAFIPLIANHPLLQKVHSIPLKRIKKNRDFSLLKQTIKHLRSVGEFDVIIDMQGLIKSAITARLIGKNVHGFDKHSTRESLASVFYTSQSAIAYEENIVRRNCRVVSDALHLSVTDNDILEKRPLFERKNRPESLDGDKNIAIIVGASWPSKIYPKEHVIRLCQSLHVRCHIIWGNDAERDEASSIASACVNAVLAPKMDLKMLVNFIAHCDLTIGNDTGPTHMAWAMNRPSITLFGPTSHRMIFETPINIAMESHTPVDVRRIDKNDFSIASIPPERIAKKAKELL